MTLFKVGDGRMAIRTMNAKHTWYNICKEQSLVQMSTAAELV